VVASFTVEDFGLGSLEKITRSDIERRYRHIKKLVDF